MMICLLAPCDDGLSQQEDRGEMMHRDGFPAGSCRCGGPIRAVGRATSVHMLLS